MEIAVEEMQLTEIHLVVDYFLDATPEFLESMGADYHKLPARSDWIVHLERNAHLPDKSKEYYYLLWKLNGEPVGHSNINEIKYGEHALMHLHLWQRSDRTKGLGTTCVKKSLPFYFDKFKLKQLICQPYAYNPAPNKVLKKVGFEFQKQFKTTPGKINFYQSVKRYVLTRSRFEKLYTP